MVLPTSFVSNSGNFRPARGFGRELGWCARDTRSGEFSGVPVKVLWSFGWLPMACQPDVRCVEREIWGARAVAPSSEGDWT